MGLIQCPYIRFLLFSAIGGVGWATCTCLLADFPLSSIVVSVIVTTVLIAGVYWNDRRRHADDSPSTPAVPAP